MSSRPTYSLTPESAAAIDPQLHSLTIAWRLRSAVGPLSFLVLIAVMAVLSFRGILGADSASQHEPNDTYDRVDDRER